MRERRPTPAIRSALLDNLFARASKWLNLVAQRQNFVASQTHGVVHALFRPGCCWQRRLM
jgi:hypothetical protein